MPRALDCCQKASATESTRSGRDRAVENSPARQGPEPSSPLEACSTQGDHSSQPVGGETIASPTRPRRSEQTQTGKSRSVSARASSRRPEKPQSLTDGKHCRLVFETIFKLLALVRPSSDQTRAPLLARRCRRHGRGQRGHRIARAAHPRARRGCRHTRPVATRRLDQREQLTHPAHARQHHSWAARRVMTIRATCPGHPCRRQGPDRQRAPRRDG